MEKPKVIILCVDDDDAGPDALRELLELSGYEVLGVRNREQAFRLFASHPIDAVVLDYQMFRRWISQ